MLAAHCHQGCTLSNPQPALPAALRLPLPLCPSAPLLPLCCPSAAPLHRVCPAPLLPLCRSLMRLFMWGGTAPASCTPSIRQGPAPPRLPAQPCPAPLRKDCPAPLRKEISSRVSSSSCSIASSAAAGTWCCLTGLLTLHPVCCAAVPQKEGAGNYPFGFGSRTIAGKPDSHAGASGVGLQRAG